MSVPDLEPVQAGLSQPMQHLDNAFATVPPKSKNLRWELGMEGDRAGILSLRLSLNAKFGRAALAEIRASVYSKYVHQVSPLPLMCKHLRSSKPVQSKVCYELCALTTV
ncbi:hypothetical protein Cpir12675_006683 [Ceratocystis pirilliformis]|uniref:Uncharacterized protein n=1 Tax=Ceratocystis pirilliformis TaxID=259994 RepID=A0ABR3YH87_9PEZI